MEKSVEKSKSIEDAAKQFPINKLASAILLGSESCTGTWVEMGRAPRIMEIQ